MWIMKRRTAEWRKQALEQVKEALSSGNEAEVVQLPVGQAAPGHSAYNKQNPYTATLLTSQKITVVIRVKMFAT